MKLQIFYQVLQVLSKKSPPQPTSCTTRQEPKPTREKYFQVTNCIMIVPSNFFLIY